MQDSIISSDSHVVEPPDTWKDGCPPSTAIAHRAS